MSKRQRERETAAGRRNLVHSEPVSKKPGPTLLSLTRKREKIPSTSLKRSPRAKRPMTKRFLLPMMMFLNIFLTASIFLNSIDYQYDRKIPYLYRRFYHTIYQYYTLSTYIHTFIRRYA